MIDIENFVIILHTFQKELDETVECRPTFEQVGLDPIIDEMGKNITVLKCLEGIFYERQNGMAALNTSLSRTRTYFESIDFNNCSVKNALEALDMLSDQVD
jgi:hypothetical protein